MNKENSGEESFSNSLTTSGSSDSEQESKPAPTLKDIHGQKKTSPKGNVPIINLIPTHHSNSKSSPRILLEHVQTSEGSRLYVSPRHTSPSGSRLGVPQPLKTSDPSSPKLVKILSGLKGSDSEHMSFVSPRIDQSPRVFESRMIEIQQQYERANANMTKLIQRKSEEINEKDMKVKELSDTNEGLKKENLELRAQLEQAKQKQEQQKQQHLSSEKEDKENMETLYENLTNLALENMELRTKMGRIQGSSVACENSIQLLSKLKKDENLAVLKSSVFEYHQKQLSYDRSIELYEQEIRKVIHGARQSISKEKEKRKQLEQEIRSLHGKIRELEFFIIEELADLADFSECDPASTDSVNSNEYVNNNNNSNRIYNYHGNDDEEEDEEEDDEEEYG